MSYLCIVLFFITSLSYAKENIWYSSGEIQYQTRNFEHDNKSVTHDSTNTLYSYLKLGFEQDEFIGQVSFFTKTDPIDKTRDVFAHDETYVGYQKNDFNIKFGYQIYNWSVLEAFHPVDTINSRNFDNSSNRPEKFGELSLNFIYAFDQTTLQLIQFYTRTESQIPNITNRLSAGFLVNPSKHVKDDNDFYQQNELSAQYAIRLTHNFSGLDVGLHYFEKHDTVQPFFALDDTSLATSGITPYFFKVQQTGATMQMVFEDLLIKGEVAYRKFAGHKIEAYKINSNAFPPITYDLAATDYTLAAVGSEYTHNLYNGSDITFYLEYQFISDVDKELARWLQVFQNDGMFGVRYNYNDFHNKEIGFFVFHDIDLKNETLLQTYFSRTLIQDWKGEIGLRIVDAPEVKKNSLDPYDYTGLKTQSKSDHVYFNLTRFF